MRKQNAKKFFFKISNFFQMAQKTDLILNAFQYAIRQTWPSKCVKTVYTINLEIRILFKV